MRFLALALLPLAAAAAEMPVTSVVLYKHGIGYFERSGKLAAGETARLEFRVAEMNDMLKSLTVSSRGGGVRALRYDAAEPLAQKLGEFPFRLGERQSLAALLDQLKGARVQMRVGGEALAGTIVAARTVAVTDNQPERELLSLMTDAFDLRTVDVAAVTSLRFDSAALAKQLQEYLEVLSRARSTDRRAVYIESPGAKGGDITASYMVPMPAWKSSYRLIFPPSDTSGQPLLEGWAIVDNTTAEDWGNVSLSLVSGRPVSFVSRMYEPRHVFRPTVDLAEDRAVAPQVFGGAIASQKPAPAAAMPRAAPAAPAALAARDVREERAAESTIAAAAQGRELGELFEYRIPGHISVRRGESAMLPFVQERINVRKLLVYTGAAGIHPMHAAELSNSTGKTLDGGPITVFEGGAYGGEALMETVKAGDRRLIGYGVDLGTRISTRFDSGSELLREVRLERGVLTTRVAARETRTYTVRNVDATAKTLVIEQPTRPGYSLVERTANEKTATSYRFELKLAPGAEVAFPVVEERVYDQTTAVTNMSTEAIVAIVQNRTLSPAARKQLEQLVGAKERVSDLENQLKSADQQLQALAADQDRVRRNIQSLNAVAGQQETVQQYAKQLSTLEGQIAKLRDRRADIERQLNAARQQVNQLVSSLSF